MSNPFGNWTIICLILSILFGFSSENKYIQFDDEWNYPTFPMTSNTGRTTQDSIRDSMNECRDRDSILQIENITVSNEVMLNNNPWFWRSPLFCKIDQPVPNSFCMMFDIYGKLDQIFNGGNEEELETKFNITFCYWDGRIPKSPIQILCYNKSILFESNIKVYKCFDFVAQPNITIPGIYEINLKLINVESVRSFIIQKNIQYFKIMLKLRRREEFIHNVKSKYSSIITYILKDS